MASKRHYINVAFKPEAEEAKITEALSRYEHLKIFGLNLNPNASRHDNICARTYGFFVMAETADKAAEQIRREFSDITEFIEVPARRKLPNPRPNKLEL